MSELRIPAAKAKRGGLTNACVLCAETPVEWVPFRLNMALDRVRSAVGLLATLALGVGFISQRYYEAALPLCDLHNRARRGSEREAFAISFVALMLVASAPVLIFALDPTSIGRVFAIYAALSLLVMYGALRAAALIRTSASTFARYDATTNEVVLPNAARN
ncbi:MAG: hypothetical protein IPK60_04285 [Sandaracinaceae bacterium]|nr:hypothetical protein [Sandaracinaceae bacterium]